MYGTKKRTTYTVNDLSFTTVAKCAAKIIRIHLTLFSVDQCISSRGLVTYKADKLFQVSGATISSLLAKMVNALRRTCSVMATLRVKTNQTKTTVNVLQASLVVRESVSQQPLCATAQSIAPMEMTKNIAVP